MTQRIFDRVETLEELIDDGNWNDLFVVADPVAYEQSGARARLKATFQRRRVRHFAEFDANPKIQHALAGAKLLRADGSATVVAIGGGTAIDMGKLICLLAAHEGELPAEGDAEFLRAAAGGGGRRHPLVAVPTTAGTGSEATDFAVVYIGEAKHSALHGTLLPDAAVLDPTLTYSLPPRLTASTGLDALSQAIESMWSVRSTDESMELAEWAMRLGLEHLERAASSPTAEDRAAMMQAAHLSGRAINISHTTAPHALSYSLSIRHGLPHGMAVAISLGHFIRFNAQADTTNVADPRGIGHVQGVMRRIAMAFGVDARASGAMEQVAQRWRQMLGRLGCPTRLSQCGINDPAERLRLAHAVNEQRLANNPRRLTTGDVEAIVDAMA